MNLFTPEGKRNRSKAEAVHPTNPIAAELYAGNVDWTIDIAEALDERLRAQLQEGDVDYVLEQLRANLADGPTHIPSKDELIEFRARLDGRPIFDFGQEETGYEGLDY